MLRIRRTMATSISKFTTRKCPDTPMCFVLEALFLHHSDATWSQTPADALLNISIPSQVRRRLQVKLAVGKPTIFLAGAVCREFPFLVGFPRTTCPLGRNGPTPSSSRSRSSRVFATSRFAALSLCDVPPSSCSQSLRRSCARSSSMDCSPRQPTSCFRGPQASTSTYSAALPSCAATGRRACTF